MRTLLLAVTAVAALLAGALITPTAGSARGPVVAIGLDSDGNPLRGQVVVASTPSSEITIEVRGPDGDGLRITPTRPQAGRTTIPLLGLEASTTYTVTATVDGDPETARLTTGGLPLHFPPITVEAQPERVQPGITLLDIRAWNAPQAFYERGDGIIAGLDASGDLVWYLRTPLTQEDTERTPQGTLVFTYNEGAIREYSFTGELLHEWAGRVPRELVERDRHGHPSTSEDPIAVATDQMHHEVVQLKNGNLLTLSREVRTISGFPEPICKDSKERFDGTYRVGSDIVVELDPDTGRIVREWAILDYTSPLDYLDVIHASSFCASYLNRRYPDLAPVRDFTHANGLAVDRGRNVLWVSLRHLDQIWGFRWRGPQAGTLLFKLGPNGDFELTSGQWFYYQHAPEVQADGSLVVYDNGNFRPGTEPGNPGDLPYTRTVRYQIDTKAMTARQVFEDTVEMSPPSQTDGQSGPEVFAPFLGDADRQANGNLLIGHGGAVDPPTTAIFGEGVLQYSRVVELVPGSGEIVWDATIRDPDGEVGWSSYRAERIPTLYPPRYEVVRFGP